MAGSKEQGEEGQRPVPREDAPLQKEEGGQDREGQGLAEGVLPPEKDPAQAVEGRQDGADGKGEGFAAGKPLTPGEEGQPQDQKGQGAEAAPLLPALQPGAGDGVLKALP